MFETDNQLMHNNISLLGFYMTIFFMYTLIHALFPSRLLPLYTSRDKIGASLVVG
jgi:hypothetical protein